MELIKLCLNEAYSTARVVKHLSVMFLIKNGLEQGDAVSSFLFNCASDYKPLGGLK
jgi:hypothetical protein